MKSEKKTKNTYSRTLAEDARITIIGAADFLFLPIGQRTNSFSPPSHLLSSPFLFSPPSSPRPFLPLPFSSLSPPFRSRPLQLGGLGERCKLPQWGLGRSSTADKRFEAYIGVKKFLSIFLRTDAVFCTTTSLISYGGFNSSQRGAQLGVRLLGQSPPLHYGSRRL